MTGTGKITGSKMFLWHDLATLGYLSAIILIIILAGWGLKDFWCLLGANLMLLAAVILIANLTALGHSRMLNFLHIFYPVLLFTFFYRETGLLNNLLFPHYFDRYLRVADIFMFGFSPSEQLARFYPSGWLSEYAHFSYFCYYLLIPGMWFYLFLRQRQKIAEYMFVVCASFYFYYLCFIFFPAVGGRTYADIYALPGYFFTGLMRIIYHHGEINGGAFPSSHVALALIALYYTEGAPRILSLLISLIFIGLVFATIYCGYHYVIDVLAGIFTAVLLYHYFVRLYRKYGEPHEIGKLSTIE